MVTKINNAAARIQDTPFIGGVREHVARTARAVLVDPYLILYRIDEEDVEIVRVVHAARNLRTFATDFDEP